MEHRYVARIGRWEVWVGKFQFDQWDAFVRRLAGGVVQENALVPGGPFASRPEAGQAGILYAGTKPL
jgi:hypothetical protein